MSELLRVDPLFADGYHNAFTDLMFWRGHSYLFVRRDDRDTRTVTCCSARICLPGICNA